MDQAQEITIRYLEDLIVKITRYTDYLEEIKQHKTLRRNPVFNQMLKTEHQRATQENEKACVYVKTLLKTSSSILVRQAANRALFVISYLDKQVKVE